MEISEYNPHSDLWERRLKTGKKSPNRLLKVGEERQYYYWVLVGKQLEIPFTYADSTV